MEILKYLLYLGLTLLVALPFVVAGASAIIASYFQYKEKHIGKLTAAGAKFVEEVAKKIPEIKREKENE